MNIRCRRSRSTRRGGGTAGAREIGRNGAKCRRSVLTGRCFGKDLHTGTLSGYLVRAVGWGQLTWAL